MSLQSTPVVVVGAGARTAVGMTAAATAAAVRAGLSGFAQHPFVVDTSGNRVVVALAPYVGADLSGAARLAELAGPAAAEAAAPLASASSGKPGVPVFLGVPANRPGRAKDLGPVTDRVTAEVAAAGLEPRNVSVIEVGHAAGAMAIQAAWETIRSGAAEFALAGGVDSYVEPETMEWLEANDQLHSAGPDNNPYGFVPGEAGGFVLLGSETAARRRYLTATVQLLDAQTAREAKLIKTESVCTGEGLTALFGMLAAQLAPGIQVDHLYCDMNGEPYRADEFGFAAIRAGSLFRDAAAFTAPADCWGDVGAASGPLFVMLAEAAARKGYASGSLAAGVTSSESGERSGFVTRSRATEVR